jgi:hypothetical protein
MFDRAPPLPGWATIPPHAALPISAGLRARPSASGAGAPPPNDPLAWSDQEAVPRRPLLPPTRRDIATAASLLVAGIAWGVALAFTESLPVDFRFLVFVLQLGVGLVFIVTLVHRLLFRGFHVDRVVIVAALVVGGGAVGMEIGPTVPPAVTVVGSYTFTPAMPAAPATQGALACEWANGRWRVGVLTTTTPISGLPTPHVLTVNLLDRQVQLSDGASSTLLAEGDSAVQPPPGETARGAGDRTGAIAIDVLQVNLAAGPSEVNEVRGIFRWICPGPPG